MPASDGSGRRRSEAVLRSEETFPLHLVNTCFGSTQMVPAEDIDPRVRPAPADDRELSLRAVNVLKILAGEIVGEIPPREGWVPSEDLLRKISVARLSIARNCGPRTVDEIIRWAEGRGVTIQPMLHAGKSLSETWRDLGARFAAGELTKAELAGALEKSVRRKSTKVPVSIQRILLKYLGMAGDGPLQK